MNGKDIKLIFRVPKKTTAPVAPVPTAEEIAAKKAANQKLAQRFMMSLSADQTRLAFERYPELEQAYNGEYSGELDPRNIRIINPEKVERAAGPYLDPARERSIARSKAVREANDPARAVNRALANAWRGRNFDQSKG